MAAIKPDGGAGFHPPQLTASSRLPERRSHSIFSLLQCPFSGALSISPFLPTTLVRPFLSPHLSLYLPPAPFSLPPRVNLILLRLLTFPGSLSLFPHLSMSLSFPVFPRASLLPSFCFSCSLAPLLPAHVSLSLSPPLPLFGLPVCPGPAQPPPWSCLLPWIDFKPQRGAEPQKFYGALGGAPPSSSVHSTDVRNHKVSSAVQGPQHTNPGCCL